MPIAVDWMIPDYVFITYLWGEVTFAQFVDAVPPGIELVRSVATHKVHNWIDARHIERYPHDVRNMSREVDIFDEPNLDQMIGITSNAMLRVIGQFSAMMRGKQIHMCRNLQEGFAYLAEMDLDMPTITIADYEVLLQRIRKNPVPARE